MTKINPTIHNRIKKINHYLILGLIFLLIAISSSIFLVFKNISSKEKTYLNDIIEFKRNTPNITAYLKVNDIPKSFAKYSDEDYAFYIINDGDYYYIAYLNDPLYKKLNNDQIKDHPKTISGVSEKIPEEVKALAIETYNEEINPNDPIKDDEFTSFFGDVYLNTSKTKQKPALLVIATSSISFILTIIFLTIFLTKKIKIKKSFQKISLDDQKNIEQNLANTKAFNFDKARITFCDNYLISFTKDIDIINYSDIIWLYEYEVKKNTISINIMLINGKTKTIAKIGKNISNKEEIINEIIEIITGKNDDILIGFTKENNKQAKKTIKEFKNSAK